jgi:hypothetical protein
MSDSKPSKLPESLTALLQPGTTERNKIALEKRLEDLITGMQALELLDRESRIDGSINFIHPMATSYVIRSMINIVIERIEADPKRPWDRFPEALAHLLIEFVTDNDYAAAKLTDFIKSHRKKPR